MSNSSDLSIKNKDDFPINSILKARLDLQQIGILVQELWNSVGSSIFSVHIIVLNTTLTANGKGISKELALASAYGELIERLSFCLPFRVSPFYKMFYEKIYSVEENKLFIHMPFENWIKSSSADTYFSLLNNGLEENSKDHCINLWCERKGNCRNYDLVSRFNLLLPSNSSLDESLFQYELDISYAVLDYYYGSNGMCAGNTKEEALVQGICEIIERAVQFQVLAENENEIYDITDSYFTNSSNINNDYKYLYSHNFKLKILLVENKFNCPVIAVIIFNDIGGYYVSFGCHPNIWIAIERSITELFQGYSLDTLSDAFKYEYLYHDDHHKNENYVALLKYGVGHYPMNFILRNYPVMDIKNFTCAVKTNVDYLDEIIVNIMNLGLPIYAVSGLDFDLHTFQVIIPSVSEAENILPARKLRSDAHDSIYSNLSEVDRKSCLKIADYCSELWANGDKTMVQLLDISNYSIYERCETQVDGIQSSLFISMLYIKAKEWDKAYEYMLHFLSEIKIINGINKENFIYYSLYSNALDMLRKGASKDYILESIKMIDPQTFDELQGVLFNNEDIFINFPKLESESLLAYSESLRNCFEAEKTCLNSLLCR